MNNTKPIRVLNNARVGVDGRITSDLHCDKHPCTDKIRWPDGTTECMMCARDRQIDLMTEQQKKNVGFNMPKYEDWVQ